MIPNDEHRTGGLLSGLSEFFSLALAIGQDRFEAEPLSKTTSGLFFPSTLVFGISAAGVGTGREDRRRTRKRGTLSCRTRSSEQAYQRACPLPSFGDQAVVTGLPVESSALLVSGRLLQQSPLAECRPSRAESVTMS